MLTRYKKCHEKIAMGLLSFMPKEKEVSQLKATLLAYEEDEKQTLFLHKEGEDFIAIIGVKETDNQVVIQHLSVLPSHRNNGIGYLMVQEIKKKYTENQIIGNENVSSFCDKHLVVSSK